MANRVTPRRRRRGFLGWPGVTLGSHTASRAPPPHRATLVTLVTPGASKQAHTKSPLQLEFLTSTFLTRHLSHAQDQAEAEAQAQAVAAQGQTSNGVSIGALLTDVLRSLRPLLAILTNLWSNFGHRHRSPSLKRTVDPPQPLQPPQLGKDSNSLGGFGVALLGAGGGFPVACMEIPYEWVHQHMNRIQLEQHCPGNLRSLVSVWHCGIFCHVVRHLTFDRPASRRPPLRGLHWSSIAVLLM